MRYKMDEEKIFKYNSLSAAEKKELLAFYKQLKMPEENQSKNFSKLLAKQFLELKTKYKNSFDKNPAVVFVLFKTIQFMTLEDFKSIFPAQRAVLEQNIYDYSTEIFKSQTNDDAVENFAKSFVAQAFTEKSIRNNSSKKYEKDLLLLQQLFFFLLWDIAKRQSTYDEKLFIAALNKKWYSNETLSEILNVIARKSCFNTKQILHLADFRTLQGIHFQQNESILQLLYNFTRPDFSLKSGIVSELNFVREQQKAILPVWPNTKKENYSQAEADGEIQKVKENLKILSRIDFGFSDAEFEQCFMLNSENKKRTFKRPIKCKCFRESEMEWKRLSRKEGKIIAYNNDAVFLEKALGEKYLYLERNIITHYGDSLAIFILFTKDFNKEKHVPQELMLNTFYYAKKYLERFKNIQVSQDLLKILNYFFTKATSKLPLTDENRWDQVFAANGKLLIKSGDIKKTNLFNILTPTELSYFKRFMGFLYCSENVTRDFITSNKTRIMVYLIYLSLELSKRDK